jgi:hypothetical protein
MHLKEPQRNGIAAVVFGYVEQGSPIDLSG